MGETGVDSMSIDTMVKEQLSIKNELTSLKDTLQQLEKPTKQNQDDLHTIQEFIALYPCKYLLSKVHLRSLDRMIING